MDYTASQQIGNIIADMEPEDAIQVLTANLRSLDVAVKVWVRDDILSHLQEYHDPEGRGTERQYGIIADDVMESRYWQNLEDASNEDWENINQGIIEAVTNRRWSFD